MLGTLPLEVALWNFCAENWVRLALLFRGRDGTLSPAGFFRALRIFPGDEVSKMRDAKIYLSDLPLGCKPK